MPIVFVKEDILAKLTPIDAKVSSLWDEKNKREGALGLSKLIVGCLGGAFGSALTLAAEMWLRK